MTVTDGQVGWDRQTSCTPPPGQRRGCSPVLFSDSPRRPGGRRRLTLPGEKEPSPLPAAGPSQRFLAAPSNRSALPSSRPSSAGSASPAGSSFWHHGSAAQKAPSTKRAGSEGCQSRDRACGDSKCRHYSGQDPGKAGAHPYLETSEGREMAVNKRSGPPGERTSTLERAERQRVCGRRVWGW